MQVRIVWLVLAALVSLPAVAATPGLSTGEHRFTTSDGVSLWYQVGGLDRGPPVVFLHGGPGEGSQVMRLLAGPALERRVRMVYLDQRGSGRSERPKGDRHYSLAIVQRDIEELRRHLGAPRLVLLAHSAGTPMALDYAAAHPEHVAGLILTGAVPDLPAAIDKLCDRVKQVRPNEYARAVAEAAPGRRCNPFAVENAQAFNDSNMFPDRAIADRVNALDNAKDVANSGDLGGALFRQGLMDYRFDRPTRLNMPLLFIAGGSDFQTAMEPERALAARVRHGQVVVYPGAGHFMFVEQPERFARDVGAFVRRLR